MSNPEINTTMNVPPLPKTSYYNINSSADSKNSSGRVLYKKINDSCGEILDTKNNPGIFKLKGATTVSSTIGGSDIPINPLDIPSDIDNNDIPVFLAKSGKLTDENLTKAGVDKQNTRNQIRYMACQLVPSSNSFYDSGKYLITNTNMDLSKLKGVFTFGGIISLFLVIVLIITMFLLINGVFSSMDLVRSIFGKLEKTNKNTIFYWIGILIGISVPMLVLIIVYVGVVMNNISNLENYEITNDPYPYLSGKQSVGNDKKSLDISGIFLFIILIYAFVAVLFTIKKESFSPLFYNMIIIIILVIITVFMYVLYSLVPFFNSADQTQMNNMTQDLRLFITGPGSAIMSNQQDDNSLRMCFAFTFVAVFFLSMVYFSIKGENSLLNGIFGSCAILVVPGLWLLNFAIGIQYFFAYPIILVIARFVRYSYMSVLYIMSENNPSMKDQFSADLAEKLTNFKNYSPTWGLLGVDEMKIWLNIHGYENTFSQSILPEETTNANLSSNKYTAGIFGVASFMKDSNKSSMLFSICIWILSIIISFIILKSI